MHHAYMYNGAFEKNYTTLRPGATAYVGTDGERRPLPPWPDKIDGVRVGYMEKSGKKFFAVRVQYEDHDIVLENPIALDPLVHMGNRRFAADPTLVGDEEASQLLDDIIRDNPDKQPELAMLINRINQARRASRASPE
jgi:hypothetical protein